MAGELHHAYLITGGPEEAESFFGALLAELSFEVENNPDYFTHEPETFGIDDARKLRDQVVRRAFGDKKVFRIRPGRFTLEAQNALLKTLEEPTLGTHIILFTREKEDLIPTLLSRLSVISTGVPSDSGTGPKKFLGMSVPERLEFAKKFSDSDESLEAFLDGLLSIIRKNPSASDELREVLEMRKLALGPSPSSKLILEHLSFAL